MHKQFIVFLLLFNSFIIGAASSSSASPSPALMKYVPTGPHIARGTLQQLAALSFAKGLIEQKVQKNDVKLLPPMILQQVIDQYCFLYSKEIAAILYKIKEANPGIDHCSALKKAHADFSELHPTGLGVPLTLSDRTISFIRKAYHILFTPNDALYEKDITKRLSLSIQDWIDFGSPPVAYKPHRDYVQQPNGEREKQTIKDFSIPERINLEGWRLTDPDGLQNIKNLNSISMLILDLNPLESPFPEIIFTLRNLKHFSYRWTPISNDNDTYEKLKKQLPHTTITSYGNFFNDTHWQ